MTEEPEFPRLWPELTQYLKAITPSTRYGFHEGGPTNIERAVSLGLAAYDNEYLKPHRFTFMEWEAYDAYWFNSRKNLLTTADISQPPVLQRIETAYNLAVTGSILPPHVEIVLEPDVDDNTSCRYYLVDHESFSPFWLSTVCSPQSLGFEPGCCGVHLKHQFAREYWTHVQRFPNHIALDPAIEEELKEILARSFIDQITCDPSGLPYPENKIKQFNHALQSCPPSMKTWTIAKIKHYIASRETTKCNCPSSKLSWGNIPEESRMYLFPLRVVSICVLFNAQKTYFDKLVRVERAHSENWSVFVSDVTRGWNDIGIFAAGILSGNLAFLALISGNPNPTTISGVSIVFALGSILTSFMNTWRLRNLRTPGESYRTLQLTNQSLGFWYLALFYALPYILGMWAMIIFASAIILHSFETLQTASMVVIAVMAALVGCLVAATGFFVRERVSTRTQ